MDLWSAPSFRILRRRRLRRLAGPCLPGSSGGERQLDAGAEAAAGAVLQAQAPAMALDDGEHDRQAEAEAARGIEVAGTVAAHERLEHGAALGIGNAGPVVEHLHRHARPVAGPRRSHDEARTIVPGETVGVFDAPFGRVGLSVCYDLRFPELYRAMGECALVIVPAAFTHTTGRAHWEVLLRARAIENQCYVLAAAQGGLHVNGRRTYGHSMLVDPWGEVKAVLPEGEGVISGELDPGYLAGVRESLPALRHRKM